MMNELFNEIPIILKQALIAELKVPRRSRTYNGQLKPVTDRTRVYPATPPIASGNLIRNINVYWQETDVMDSPRLVAEMPYYWTWVDEGRRPGKYPPLAAIDRWSVVKPGLSGVRDEKGRFIPRKTLNFLRARSIAKYGYKGNNFVDKAIAKTINQITEKLGEAAAAYVQDLIKDQFFIVNL